MSLAAVESFFDLHARKTTVARELRGGVSTFLTMAYILMATSLARIDFTHSETALPAFVTMLLVPLTYSIAHGIGFGMICYVALAVLRGRAAAVHPVMYTVSAAFAAFFASE